MKKTKAEIIKSITGLLEMVDEDNYGKLCEDGQAKIKELAEISGFDLGEKLGDNIIEVEMGSLEVDVPRFFDPGKLKCSVKVYYDEKLLNEDEVISPEYYHC